MELLKFFYQNLDSKFPKALLFIIALKTVGIEMENFFLSCSIILYVQCALSLEYSAPNVFDDDGQRYTAYETIDTKHPWSKAIRIHQITEFAKAIEHYKDELRSLDKEKASGLWSSREYDDLKDSIDTYMLIAISVIPVALHSLAKEMLDREGLNEFMLFFHEFSHV